MAAEGSLPLRGRVAIVTGGAQGIGAAIARRLASDGAGVAILDVDAATGADCAASLRSDGLIVEFIRCNVSLEPDVVDAVSAVRSGLGVPDILVNNAGINAYFDATTMTEDNWRDVFDVDLKGAWLCSKHVLPAMLAGRRGAIANVASIHARQTIAGMFPYAAAKAGLIGLTRSLALDVAPRQVTVNVICPGFIRTRLVEEWLARQPDPQAAEEAMLAAHPLGRIGMPADVAALAAFLVSDQATFITGASMCIDGGLTAKFAS